MVGRRLERSYRRGSRESDRFQKEVFSRVYPERQKEVVLSLQLLELLARNIYFSQGLIVVCQGRQRRDASAGGEEQLGRCSAIRLYPSWRYTFDEFESLTDSFAAGAPPPTHV